MKRITAAILVIVMLFSLCACGISGAESNVTNDYPTTTEGKDLFEEILDTGSYDDPVDIYRSITDDSDSMESSEEEPVIDFAYKNAEYTLNDYVVVDNEICTFIIKNIDPAGEWGFTLNVFCENKTDKPLRFIWDNVSFMGFMIYPNGINVAAGEKVNEPISFSHYDLEQIGMQSVDEITFTLRVVKDDDWSIDAFFTEEYTIYPTGKNIKDISYPTRRTTDTEVFLYDTDEYSAIILSNETDGSDFLIHCYLENKTDHEIIFTMDYAYVNGYMVDPRWGTSVAAGKKIYDTVCFEDYLLDEHGISAVEQIMISLRVLNADSMDAHATDVFSYIP